MALPSLVNLTAYAGDTWTQQFRLKLGDTPVDLTGATVRSWAQQLQGAVVELAVTVPTPTDGLFYLGIGPDGLPHGSYTYDVEVTQAGIVTTWIRGSLVVTADITQPAEVTP